MKKTVFLCLLCVLFLFSCGKTESADAFFESFCDACPLPQGMVFLKTPNAKESERLTKEMFDMLYATAPDTDYYEEFEEGFVWLGTSLENVCEFAVFCCPDRESAEEIAFMCHARIELLKALQTDTNKAYTEDARVCIYGKTVFMCVLPDNAKAQKTASRYLS